MIITPRRAVMSALFGLPRARKKPAPELPDWKAMQRLGPVAKPGPAPRPPRPQRKVTPVEARARRLSTRSSRRRAQRRASQVVGS